MAKVSIVIPVYNVEKFIEQSLNSIAKQTFQDIEIIIVDDKGDDKSIDIAKNFAKNDNRIIIVEHEKNKGLRCAVMTGVDCSTSKYVMFADSDDYLRLDYIETLYKEIIRTDVDCVSSGFVEQSENEDKISLLNETRTFNKNEIKKEIIDYYFEQTENFHDVFGNSRVGKIYKTEIVKKAFVGASEAVTMGEDVELNLRFLLVCESVATLSDYAGYFYRVNRENSMTNLYTMKRLKGHEFMEKEVEKLARQYNLEGKALGKNNPYRHLFNFLNADTEHGEKMLCVKTILEGIPHSTLVENSVQELFIYLSSNIPFEYKLSLLNTVIERLEKTDVITSKQKDEYLVSFMFHYLKSNLSASEKIKAIKKQKEILSDKRYLLEVSKDQPFMGKIAYILIYLGFERLLVSMSN